MSLRNDVEMREKNWADTIIATLYEWGVDGPTASTKKDLQLFNLYLFAI